MSTLPQLITERRKMRQVLALYLFLTAVMYFLAIAAPPEVQGFITIFGFIACLLALPWPIQVLWEIHKETNEQQRGHV